MVGNLPADHHVGGQIDDGRQVLAAVSLMIVMEGAAWSHVRRGGPREYAVAGFVVVTFLACGFVPGAGSSGIRTVRAEYPM